MQRTLIVAELTVKFTGPRQKGGLLSTAARFCRGVLATQDTFMSGIHDKHGRDLYEYSSTVSLQKLAKHATLWSVCNSRDSNGKAGWMREETVPFVPCPPRGKAKIKNQKVIFFSLHFHLHNVFVNVFHCLDAILNVICLFHSVCALFVSM